MNCDPTAKYVIGAWWLVLILVVIGFSTGILFIKDDKPEGRLDIEETWCQSGQVMSDGTIIYSSDKKQEELIVVMTTTGPLLMAKCE